MFSVTVSTFLALTAVALLLHRVAVWATFRHTRPVTPKNEPGSPCAPRALPALSVLKPIKGLEEQLEQNLRSFLEQAYPAPLQFVFASTSPSDEGIAVARRVAQDYPQVETRFVVSDPSFGWNPKVSNIAGALRAAHYDLVLQTDANVRVRPGYLRDVVQEYVDTDAAMLGSLIAGVGERSLGAVLDNIQLTTFTTPGICLASEVAGVECVIGKSMLFRASELAELGGLALVKDVLAEDFVLGQTYEQAGKKVVLSRFTVENVNIDAPLSRFLGRHSRWLKMRVVIHLGGFIADLLSNATFFALLAFLASGCELRLLGLYAGVIAYKSYYDARIMRRLRGTPLSSRHFAYIPLRDILLPMLWFYALFSRTTEWRGERFHLGKRSLLTPLQSTLPERVMRRLGSR